MRNAKLIVVVGLNIMLATSTNKHIYTEYVEQGRGGWVGGLVLCARGVYPAATPRKKLDSKSFIYRG